MSSRLENARGRSVSMKVTTPRKVSMPVFTKMAGPREHAHVDKDLIGKNASVILGKMGISAPDSVRLAVVEVAQDHPLLWTEQMMPVMPVCRAPTAAQDGPDAVVSRHAVPNS